MVIDGAPFVLKTVDRRRDWIMRQIGDLAVLPVVVWEEGLVDLAPPCIDHTLVGAARGTDGTAVLMRDVAGDLVPPGDTPIELDQHLRFLEHMAAFHAASWGWRDDVGLVPMSNRYLFFSPTALELELRRARPAPVVELAARRLGPAPGPFPRARRRSCSPCSRSRGRSSTRSLASRAPSCTATGSSGTSGVTPTAGRSSSTGRMPWSGPPCADLVHYVVLNQARLPVGHRKEDAFDAYRDALVAQGIDTEPWFERQLALCILGAMLQLGWEKALGDDAELEWWTARARDGARDRPRGPSRGMTSITVAEPMPPPAHMLATPMPPPRRRSS